MKKFLIILLVLIIVGGGIYYAVREDKAPDVLLPGDDGSSAFRAEENMVVVTEQRPGTTVTASQILLVASGFVVIHEDTDGEPGAILGTSRLLPAGDSERVTITLSRATLDGERLHAMLHDDSDDNGVFDATIDQPVQSRLGDPLGGWFEISAEASDDIPVTI